MRQALGFFVIFLLTAECGIAQETDKTIKAYAKAIAAAQADLDAGRIPETRKTLEATDKSARSFEYEYVLARAEAKTVKGSPPDLVRTIAAPKVETRYGVLNEVDRQVVFICRDGGVRIHDLAAVDAPP